MPRRSAVLRLKRDREARAHVHPWIFKGDVADSSGLAVSIEAAGGAQQPTDIQGTATI